MGFCLVREFIEFFLLKLMLFNRNVLELSHDTHLLLSDVM